MANTNFLQFDANGSNMLSDEDYASDTQRQSGVVSGIARSTLHNKQAFQASTMAKALADFLVDNDQNAFDNNLVALKQSIANTFATILSMQTYVSTYIDNNKSTISGWSVPDYGSGSSVSATYTPTKNGTLHAQVTAGAPWVQIAQGSRVLARSQATDSSNGTECVWIIAQKGKQYTVTGKSTPTIRFYPFVGA